MSTLPNILLIDADGINPEGSGCICPAQMSQCGFQVFRDIEEVIVEEDGDRVFWVTPYVGERFE
jgi:hypothetical protein